MSGLHRLTAWYMPTMVLHYGDSTDHAQSRLPSDVGYSSNTNQHMHGCEYSLLCCQLYNPEKDSDGIWESIPVRNTLIDKLLNFNYNREDDYISTLTFMSSLSLSRKILKSATLPPYGSTRDTDGPHKCWKRTIKSSVFVSVAANHDNSCKILHNTLLS